MATHRYKNDDKRNDGGMGVLMAMVGYDGGGGGDDGGVDGYAPVSDDGGGYDWL